MYLACTSTLKPTGRMYVYTSILLNFRCITDRNEKYSRLNCLGLTLVFNNRLSTTKDKFDIHVSGQQPGNEG